VKIRDRFVAGLVFLAGCTTGGALIQFDLPQAQASRSARWEYRCFRVDHTFSAGDKEVTKMLNEATRHGWELVSDVALRPDLSRTCLRRSRR